MNNESIKDVLEEVEQLEKLIKRRNDSIEPLVEAGVMAAFDRRDYSTVFHEDGLSSEEAAKNANSIRELLELIANGLELDFSNAKEVNAWLDSLVPYINNPDLQITGLNAASSTALPKFKSSELGKKIYDTIVNEGAVFGITALMAEKNRIVRNFDESKLQDNKYVTSSYITLEENKLLLRYLDLANYGFFVPEFQEKMEKEDELLNMMMNTEEMQERREIMLARVGENILNANSNELSDKDMQDLTGKRKFSIPAFIEKVFKKRNKKQQPKTREEEMMEFFSLDAKDMHVERLAYEIRSLVRYINDPEKSITLPNGAIIILELIRIAEEMGFDFNKSAVELQELFPNADLVMINYVKRQLSDIDRYGFFITSEVNHQIKKNEIKLDDLFDKKVVLSEITAAKLTDPEITALSVVKPEKTELQVVNQQKQLPAVYEPFDISKYCKKINATNEKPKMSEVVELAKVASITSDIEKSFKEKEMEIEKLLVPQDEVTQTAIREYLEGAKTTALAVIKKDPYQAYIEKRQKEEAEKMDKSQASTENTTNKENDKSIVEAPSKDANAVANVPKMDRTTDYFTQVIDTLTDYNEQIVDMIGEKRGMRLAELQGDVATLETKLEEIELSSVFEDKDKQAKLDEVHAKQRRIEQESGLKFASVGLGVAADATIEDMIAAIKEKSGFDIKKEESKAGAQIAKAKEALKVMDKDKAFDGIKSMHNKASQAKKEHNLKKQKKADQKKTLERFDILKDVRSGAKNVIELDTQIKEASGKEKEISIRLDKATNLYKAQQDKYVKHVEKTVAAVERAKESGLFTEEEIASLQAMSDYVTVCQNLLEAYQQYRSVKEKKEEQAKIYEDLHLTEEDKKLLEEEAQIKASRKAEVQAEIDALAQEEDFISMSPSIVQQKIKQLIKEDASEEEVEEQLDILINGIKGSQEYRESKEEELSTLQTKVNNKENYIDEAKVENARKQEDLHMLRKAVLDKEIADVQASLKEVEDLEFYIQNEVLLQQQKKTIEEEQEVLREEFVINTNNPSEEAIEELKRQVEAKRNQLVEVNEKIAANEAKKQEAQSKDLEERKVLEEKLAGLENERRQAESDLAEARAVLEDPEQIDKLINADAYIADMQLLHDKKVEVEKLSDESLDALKAEFMEKYREEKTKTAVEPKTATVDEPKSGPSVDDPKIDSPVDDPTKDTTDTPDLNVDPLDDMDIKKITDASPSLVSKAKAAFKDAGKKVLEFMKEHPVISAAVGVVTSVGLAALIAASAKGFKGNTEVTETPLPQPTIEVDKSLIEESQDNVIAQAEVEENKEETEKTKDEALDEQAYLNSVVEGALEGNIEVYKSSRDALSGQNSVNPDTLIENSWRNAEVDLTGIRADLNHDGTTTPNETISVEEAVERMANGENIVARVQNDGKGIAWVKLDENSLQQQNTNEVTEENSEGKAI